MDDILEMNRVTKSYGDFQLRDICMHVPKGMIVGLIGENGEIGRASCRERV